MIGKIKIVISIIVLIFPFSLRGQDILPFATGEWAPYSSQSIDSYGLCSELVTAVVAEMGMKAEFHFYPWKRVSKLTLEGKFFAAFPYSINDERKELFDFSSILVENRPVLFYLTDREELNLELEDFTPLRPYSVGVIVESILTPILEKAGIFVDPVETMEQNFRKLKLGRLDYVAVDELLGWYEISKLFPGKTNTFSVINKPLENKNSHLMISRSYDQSEMLRIRFNEALEEVRRNGTYDKIIGKYLF